MKLTTYDYALGAFIIILLAVTISLTSLLFWIGLPLSWFVFPAALLISLALMTKLHGFEGRANLRQLASVFLLLFLVLLIVSGVIFDVSWDGQAYHQEAVLELAQGYNPIRSTVSDGNIYALWISHYAKGPWYLASSLYVLTGNIEHGKVFNLLLIAASFFLTHSVLKTFNRGPSLTKLLALLVACSPVAVNQALSYYFDGQIYSLLVCFLALAYLLYKQYQHFYAAALFASIILLVNIKFTAIAYAFIFSSALFVVFLITRPKQVKSLFTLFTAAYLFGIVLVGFNPYVTNFLQAGHPFYPLAGKGAVDIMTYNMHPELHGKGRVEKVYISLFAASNNKLSKPPELKNPFSVKFEEIIPFVTTDTRIGGFGPLFGATVILAFLAAVFFIWFERKHALPLVFLILCIVISVIINPEPWWARYIPQLWLVPVLTCIALLFMTRRLILTIGGMVMAVMLTLNVFFIGLPYLGSQLVISHLVGLQISEIQAVSRRQGTLAVSFHTFPANRARFDYYKIPYREVLTPLNERARLLVSDTTVYARINNWHDVLVYEDGISQMVERYRYLKNLSH